MTEALPPSAEDVSDQARLAELMGEKELARRELAQARDKMAAAVEVVAEQLRELIGQRLPLKGMCDTVIVSRDSVHWISVRSLQAPTEEGYTLHPGIYEVCAVDDTGQELQLGRPGEADSRRLCVPVESLQLAAEADVAREAGIS